MRDLSGMTATLSKSGACGLALISFLVWYASRLVYNVYFHPLSKFPGPRLAGASRWYEGFFDNLVGDGGQYMYEIDRIHQKYGFFAPALPPHQFVPAHPLRRAHRPHRP